MFFNARLVLLSVVAYATYTSAASDAPGCYVDYCECMRDVPKSQQVYGELYDKYYTDMNEELKKSTEEVQKRLNELKPDQLTACSLSSDPDTYISNLLALCGGNRLDKVKYSPCWRTNEPKKTTVEYCTWIVAQQPALCAQKENNLRIIKEGKYMEHFDKSIGTSIKGCGKCK